MDHFTRICARRDLVLIEDCAHAHGSLFNGQMVGTFGSAGTYSFQASKLMTGGEGGAIVTTDPEVRASAASYSDCGRRPGEWFYSHFALGGNYRMTEWQGAVLLAQLERFEEQAARRDERSALLNSALAAIPGVHPQTRDPRCDRQGNYCYVVRIDPHEFGADREPVRLALASEGIPLTMAYPPIHRLDVFRDRDGFAPPAPPRRDAGLRRTLAPGQRTPGRHDAVVHHVGPDGDGGRRPRRRPSRREGRAPRRGAGDVMSDEPADQGTSDAPPGGTPFECVERTAVATLNDLPPYLIAVNDPPWASIADRVPAPVTVVMAHDMELAKLDRDVESTADDRAEIVVGFGGGTALDTPRSTSPGKRGLPARPDPDDHLGRRRLHRCDRHPCGRSGPLRRNDRARGRRARHRSRPQRRPLASTVPGWATCWVVPHRAPATGERRSRSVRASGGTRRARPSGSRCCSNSMRPCRTSWRSLPMAYVSWRGVPARRRDVRIASDTAGSRRGRNTSGPTHTSTPPVSTTCTAS